MGETEVKELISNLFAYSKKLKEFLITQSLNEQCAHKILSDNELFTLAMVTMVGNKNP